MLTGFSCHFNLRQVVAYRSSWTPVNKVPFPITSPLQETQKSIKCLVSSARPTTAPQLSHRAWSRSWGGHRPQGKACIERKIAINPRITIQTLLPKHPMSPAGCWWPQGAAPTAWHWGMRPHCHRTRSGLDLPSHRKENQTPTGTCWHLPGAWTSVPNGGSTWWPHGHTVLTQMLRGCPGTAALDSYTRCQEERHRHKGLEWNTKEGKISFTCMDADGLKIKIKCILYRILFQPFSNLFSSTVKVSNP